MRGEEVRVGQKTLKTHLDGDAGNDAEAAAGASNRDVRIDQRSRRNGIDVPRVVHALASTRDRRRASPPTGEILAREAPFPGPARVRSCTHQRRWPLPLHSALVAQMLA